MCEIVISWIFGHPTLVSPRYPAHGAPIGLEPERHGSAKKKDEQKEPSGAGRRRESQQFHGTISKIIASQQ